MIEQRSEPSVTLRSRASGGVVSVARYLILAVFVGQGVGCHGGLLVGIGGDINKVAPASRRHTRVWYWPCHGP